MLRPFVPCWSCWPKPPHTKKNKNCGCVPSCVIDIMNIRTCVIELIMSNAWWHDDEQQPWWWWWWLWECMSDHRLSSRRQKHTWRRQIDASIDRKQQQLQQHGLFYELFNVYVMHITTSLLLSATEPSRRPITNEHYCNKHIISFSLSYLLLFRQTLCLRCTRRSRNADPLTYSTVRHSPPT